MTLTDVENAVLAWVAAASGVASGNVVFEHQNGVSQVPPASGANATINLGDLTGKGLDEVRWTFDSGQPNGSEITFTTNGYREFVATVSFFSRDTTGDAGARAAARAAFDGLRLPSVRSALNQAGLGVMDAGPVRWVPVIDAAEWLGIAVLEVRLSLRATATESTGYIATYVATGTVT